MRVAFFGAGATASVAARHLVEIDEIEGIVVSDLVGERARALAASLGGRKAKAAPISGMEVGDLAPVVRGADLAINAAHVSLDLPLMEACLDAGANYMDLSSVPSKQFPLDATFREAGLTALLGGGEDPGLGNVLARAAADALDTIDAIRIRDGDTASSPDTPLPVVWSPETFLEEVFSPGLSFEDGELVHAPPWSGRELYPFPDPVGTQPVYLMDHEEPETLGRFIRKGLRHVDLKLAIDDSVRAVLETVKGLGLLGDAPVPVDGGFVVPRKLLLRLLPRPTDLVGKVRGAAMILVEVEGTKTGERVVHRLYAGLDHAQAAKEHGATATAYLVGTGAAVFATQFARGQIDRKGVIAAECLEPSESLRLMARWGLSVVHEMRTNHGPWKGAGS